MQIFSMTGFGKSVLKTSTLHIVAEVRCLNSRSLDMNLRLSRTLYDLEPEIRARLASSLVRGKVDAGISLQFLNPEAEGVLNHDLLRRYVQMFREMCTEEHLSEQDILGAALQVPGLWKDPEIYLGEEEKSSVFQALEEALQDVHRFREKEGQKMAQVLLDLIEEIEQGRKAVLQLAGDRRSEIHQRLLEALASGDLKKAVDENRLEQEIIFYLEKLDIHEELVRLEAHIQHFLHTLHHETMCGRKLNFIAQEIGREINTAGAKAAHAGIQKHVTGMKDALEKIKELLLNVL
ncbi:MAG: YicC family protein [Flavobacteriales bacterium]|nr:YicC family protein [Flavobacteriales bacterium]MDW8432272.1 YicC/YloC family endoribonuclease [Flavobacteriales bacterium]